MQSFPGQVNTATTATTQTPSSVLIRFDPVYIRSLPGMLKIAQLVLNVLGFICILTSHLSSHSRSGWYNFVSTTGFWTTGMLLAFYLFHVVEKFDKIPWLKIEFYFCAIETACYFLAACFIAGLGFASESLAVAAFFGFCAMCVYGFDCWMKFQALRNGDYPQGQRPSTKPVSPVGNPSGY